MYTFINFRDVFLSTILYRSFQEELRACFAAAVLGRIYANKIDRKMFTRCKFIASRFVYQHNPDLQFPFGSLFDIVSCCAIQSLSCESTRYVYPCSNLTSDFIVSLTAALIQVNLCLRTGISRRKVFLFIASEVKMYTEKINSRINDHITSRESNDFPELKCRYQIFAMHFPLPFSFGVYAGLK